MLRTLTSALFISAACTTSFAQVWDISRDFSAVQEEHDWRYLYSQDGVQQFMHNYAPEYWNVQYDPAVNPSYWTNISKDSMHPNSVNTSGGRSPVNQQAVLGWKCGASAHYIIRYRVYKSNTGCGDGVLWEVRKGAGLLELVNLPFNDNIGHAASIETDIDIAQLVTFTLSPLVNDICDTTGYQAAIFGSCQFDLNRDGLVDDADFSIFIGAYNDLVTISGDFNSDGFTNDADFLLFVPAYNQLLCP